MRRLLMMLALFAGAIFLLRRFGGTLGGQAGGPARRTDGSDPRFAGPRGAGRLVRDPQCQTYLPEQSALALKGAGQHGEILWFCSDGCRAQWQAGRRAAS